MKKKPTKRSRSNKKRTESRNALIELKKNPPKPKSKIEKAEWLIYCQDRELEANYRIEELNRQIKKLQMRIANKRSIEERKIRHGIMIGVL